MATNFKESVVTGTQWNRCDRIVIQNDYGQTPMIQISEQVIMAVENSQPLIIKNQIYSIPFDPASMIELRNPNTDELIGASISQGEVYAILYSLYRQIAV